MKAMYYAREGKQWYAMPQVEDDFPEVYPFTPVMIPEELNGVDVRFDWGSNKWVDATVDVTLSEIEKLKEIIKKQDKKIQKLDTTHVNDTSDVQDQIVGITDLLMDATSTEEE